MKKTRIILIPLLCLAIILNTFAFSVQRVNANPALFIAGGGILASILVNMGYTYLTTGEVQTAWDSLDSSTKEQIENSTKSWAEPGIGYGTVILGASLYNNLLNLFGQGTLPSNMTFDSTPYLSAGDPRSEFVEPIYAALASTYQSVIWTSNNDNGHFCKSNILVSDGNIIANQNEVGDIFFSSDGTNYEQRPGYEWTWDGLQPGTLSPTGNNSWQNNYIQSSHAWNNVNLCATNTAIPVYVAGVLSGFLGGGTGSTSYVWNEGYNESVSGDVSINVPINDAPDTNVSYNGESVSLDTVIAGYGSMQAYFDAGGVITLGDGTVLSGTTATNDISSVEVQALQDLVVGEMSFWESIKAKISSIGNTLTGGITSALNAVKEWLQTVGNTISTTLTDMWDWCGELVTSIGASIVDSLVTVFIPTGGYWLSFFNDLRGQFSPAFDAFLDKLNFTFSDGNLEDITGSITVGGVSTGGKLVDFSGLREYLPTFKAWFAGLIYFLLAWYNIKQFQNLIYGSSSLPNIGINSSSNTPNNSNEIAGQMNIFKGRF